MSKMRYTLHTACCAKVLNAIAHVAHVQKVRKQGSTITMTVVCDYQQVVQDKLQQLGITYQCCPKGAKGAIGRRIRRPGLWVTVLIMMALTVLCSRVVWRVDVRCEMVDNDTQAVIHSLVQKAPVWDSQVDRDALVKAITALDGVALASVYRKGAVLVVEAMGELPDAQYSPSEYAPIVAKCDGVITKVVVESGRALVAEGDSVRRGDVLIAPEYLMDGNVSVPNAARGQVYAYVYYTTTVTYDEYQTILTPTGQRMQTALIGLGDNWWGQWKACPYRVYECQEEVLTLGQVLPLKLWRKTYIEVEERTILVPYQQKEEQIKQECLKGLLEQCKKDVQYTKFWCIISNIGSVYTVHAYVQVEEQVGVGSPAKQNGK